MFWVCHIAYRMLRAMMATGRTITKANLLQNRRVCRDPAECRSVCINPDHQRWTHLHGIRLEFKEKSDCPTNFTDGK